MDLSVARRGTESCCSAWGAQRTRRFGQAGLDGSLTAPSPPRKMLNHGSGSRPVTQPVKMKLLSKMPIRERHCWDRVLQAALDVAARRGDLGPDRVHSHS